MILRTLSREDWLAARSPTIGASDVARLLTQKMSPMFLWGRLLGHVEDPFPELLGDHGLAIEPVIRKWWLRMRGEELCAQGWCLEPYIGYLAGNVLIDSETVAGLHASPDFITGHATQVNESWRLSGLLLAELKSLDRIAGNKLDEDRPEPYAYAQNQAAMLAADGLAERGEVVYLLGNGFNGEKDIRIYEVQPDANVQAAIRELVSFVWDHVQKDVPPPPDGLDDCRRVLAALYPPEKPKREGILPAAWRAKAKRYVDLGSQIDKLERDRKAIQQEIEFEMGQRQIDSVSIAAVAGDTESYRWIRYETPATDERKGSVTCKPI